MARLLYTTNVSLDGYIEDRDGRFDWSEPGDDAFIFITDLLRTVGTHLYGRRLYQTMAVWETDPSLGAQSGLMADFAGVWRDAHKVVYSTTLGEVVTARTRLERDFDPLAVRGIKDAAARDLFVGGAHLAGQAFRAGLIDECQLFVHPMILGGGKPALPEAVRTGLELLDERRFDDGIVYLRYRVTT